MKSTRPPKKAARHSPYTVPLKDITNLPETPDNTEALDQLLHAVAPSADTALTEEQPTIEQLFAWIRDEFGPFLTINIQSMTDAQLWDFLLPKAPILLHKKYLLQHFENGFVSMEKILQCLINAIAQDPDAAIATFNHQIEEDRSDNNDSNFHPIQQMTQEEVGHWVTAQAAIAFEAIPEQPIFDEPSTAPSTAESDNPDLADLPEADLYKFYPLNAEEDGFHATIHSEGAAILCTENLAFHDKMLQQELQAALTGVDSLAGHFSSFTL